jgi:general secretion pathway protein G
MILHAPVRRAKMSRGFTFIELVITLGLIGLLALLAMPLAEMARTQRRETELREALRLIRTGIDAYKAATDSGLLIREAGASGYPPSLGVLTEALPLAGRKDVTDNAASQRMVIMRRLPRDPFSTDPALAADRTWDTRSYASRPDDPAPGADVFDVSSKSDRLGLDGTRYKEW